MTNWTHIDFIGIGGIGMSSLAQWALSQGMTVSGYDLRSSAITKDLSDKGASIRLNDQLDAWGIPDAALVVYTPAIPSNHPQLAAAIKGNHQVIKRAEMLALIANKGTCLAVAGSHGKTTTSAMLAWILHQGGMPVQAFLGGIANNFQSNAVIADSDLMVVEADEFDRSFLHLKPTAAVVTSSDADHLDIYGNEQGMQAGFEAFASKVQGALFTGPEVLGLGGKGYGKPSDTYRAEHLRIANGRQVFDLILGNQQYQGVTAGMPGRHNVDNAVAAACLAQNVGMGIETIAQGISSFTGVKRRFDVHINQEDVVYLDDYAHHPTELRQLITSLRELHPGREIAMLFQPHLYSRTQDFMQDFIEVLSSIEHLALLPIYPARELPIEGVRSEAICKALDASLQTEATAAAWLASHNKAIMVTAGAGDIDRQIPRVIANLQSRLS